MCEKPRVKCGECPNQAFTAVGDREVLDHLQGRHVMGVYALLEDETCRFLAADFDKESWRADVAAYSETCRAFDVPVAIEHDYLLYTRERFIMSEERILSAITAEKRVPSKRGLAAYYREQDAIVRTSTAPAVQA